MDRVVLTTRVLINRGGAANCRDVPKPDACTVTREAYSITASARRANGRDDAATADQLLRKAPAVLDASGTPDGFDNL